MRWTLCVLVLALAACGGDDAAGDGAGSTGGTAGDGGTAATDADGDAGDTGSSADGGSGADSGSAGETGAGPVDPDWQRVEIRLDNFAVPTAETHYACVGVTVATDQVHHMVGFEPIVDNTDITHHMVLHRLSTPIGSEPIECFDMPNSIGMSYAWAPGGEPLWLPDEAGFPIGDQGSQTHFALQVHYDNGGLLADQVDSSGVVVYLTDELRPNAAASLVLGSVGEVDIPPGDPAFEISATCSASAVLTRPVNVFATMLHAHYLGRRLWTDHYRGGELIGDVGREEVYDFDNQRLLQIDVTLQPEDELVTHCVYDSTGVTEPTGFGFGTTDEMCFNYLLVYPKPAGEFCIF